MSYARDLVRARVRDAANGANQVILCETAACQALAVQLARRDVEALGARYLFSRLNHLLAIDGAGWLRFFVKTGPLEYDSLLAGFDAGVTFTILAAEDLADTEPKPDFFDINRMFSS